MKFVQKKEIPPKYILLGMTVLCIILMLLSLLFENVVAPLKHVTGVVITPMQNGVNSIGVYINEQLDTLQDIRNLMEENEQLKATILEYQTNNKEYQQDLIELRELRTLYELDEKFPDYHKIAARVIANDGDNWFHEFVIDCGTKQGVSVNCNVIAGNGLVGIVTEVGPNYAIVRSIIDDSSSVRGMFLTNSMLCTVQGDQTQITDGYITISNIDKDLEIENGTEVVTSHVSDKYLPGITIGYASDVQVDSNNLTSSGKLTPVVDFKNLQTVLVITDLKQTLSE